MEFKSKYKLFKTVQVVDYPTYEVCEGYISGISMSYHTITKDAHGKPEFTEDYAVTYTPPHLPKPTSVIYPKTEVFVGKVQAKKHAKRKQASDQPSSYN